MFAHTQIKGICSGMIYAERGEEITVLKTNYDGHMLCSASGGLFWCWMDKLGEVKPEPPVVIKEVKPQLELF